MHYTRGFLRKSSSGKFVGVLKYKDPTNQWRQVTKTFTSDRDISEKMLVEWYVLMEDKGQNNEMRSSAFEFLGEPSSERNSISIEEAVRECLDTQLARGRIERSTHDTQLAYAERCIFPEIGSTPLERLTSADAQAWIDRMCLSISPGSARIPYSTLRKTFDRAVRSGMLPSNPLASVDPPTRVRPSRAYLPPSSVELLENAAAECWGPAHAFTCAVKLALYAGLRVGECCGLRWRDVSAPADRLRVTASIGRTTEGCYVKSPKNPSSAREFPVVAPLSAALLKRRAVASFAGEPPDGAWFVCGEGEGFSNPRMLSGAFSQLCDRAGVTDNNGRRATFHALRHTFATEAVRGGVDVRTLADLMGHAGADVTLNVYAASGEDAKIAAAARLEGAFERVWGLRPA
ncbi:MAG: site-specific integrase [Eggerthellaceae bacterium]|nr:site-specific integrase [Eggerthellaceae bacterium]